MLDQDTRREGFPQVAPDARRDFLNSTLTVSPAPGGRPEFRNDMARPLWVLLAATGVLLALACLNVAGLFLARGSARQRELTTRMALGASATRIGRQLFADSLLVAAAGGLLGSLAAPLLIRILIAQMPISVAPIDLHSSLDLRVFAFAFAASAVTGLLSGLAPALQASRTPLLAGLRERSTTGSGGLFLRRTFVIGQIAFALILLVAAALFLQTLTTLLRRGPGFSTTNLATFRLDPLRNGHTRATVLPFLRGILADLKSQPNVVSAALTGNQLLNGGSWNTSLTIQAAERKRSDRNVHCMSITPGLFRTLGTRLVAGRDLTEADTRSAALINETFARRYFAGRDPLGAHLALGSAPNAVTDIEIVGVVADFRYRDMQEQTEQAFFPLERNNLGRGVFYVRYQGSPEAAFGAIRAAVRRADPALPISDFRTVDEQIDRLLSTERMLASLLSAFGLLAGLIALVGLYGVMAFVVTRRTRELGVRLALGAARPAVLMLVLRDALAMTLAGIGLALPFVWALGRVFASQQMSAAPISIPLLAATAAVLALAATGAALIPAWRAASVDPTQALRSE